MSWAEEKVWWHYSPVQGSFYQGFLPTLWCSTGHLVDAKLTEQTKTTISHLPYVNGAQIQMLVPECYHFSTWYFSCHSKHFIFTSDFCDIEYGILKILIVVFRSLLRGSKVIHRSSFSPCAALREFLYIILSEFGRVQIIGKGMTLVLELFSACSNFLEL